MDRTMGSDTVNEIDPGRRRVLQIATGVVGGGIVASIVVPLVQSMEPSDAAVAAGAPIDVDISKLEPGQLITVKWRDRPVWVLRREPSEISVLASLDRRLKDPHSEAAQQIPACRNEYRSLRPEYFIAVGICTHLGCVPTFRPDIAPPDLGPDWKGGFVCACHGSRYDLAGRVFDGSPAPLNLPVLPHYYLSDMLVRIGELKGGEDQNWEPKIW